MGSSCNILKENKDYWTNRVDGYSEVNQTELSTPQRDLWKKCLTDEICRHFGRTNPAGLSVLDIGTGPGFFAIILTEADCSVTAIDLTPAMLTEAAQNAGPLAEKITFLEMNAQELAFEDDAFDVVISRNLTWNLPDPETAYKEWSRVLKPGGLLLNFDANWYSYLFDADARAAFDADRENTKEAGMKDENIGEDFDIMEDIARQMPLSNIRRPDWDLDCLGSLGMTASADTDIWQMVWSEEEKVNFSSTPLFMVRAGKPAG